MISKISPKKKKMLLAILCTFFLFLILLVVNAVVDSKKNPGNAGYTPSPIFLYEPDYTFNIFEDEEYLELERSILYTEGAMSTYLVKDADFSSVGPAGLFFRQYFDAVIQGDSSAYNNFFTDEYLEKNGRKAKFTMQQIYDIETALINSYEDKTNGEKITVLEFEVRYKIRRNNGTFRDDIPSRTARPQIYQLYRYPDDSILIRDITEYRYNP